MRKNTRLRWYSLYQLFFGHIFLFFKHLKILKKYTFFIIYLFLLFLSIRETAIFSREELHEITLLCLTPFILNFLLIISNIFWMLFFVFSDAVSFYSSIMKYIIKTFYNKTVYVCFESTCIYQGMHITCYNQIDNLRDNNTLMLNYFINPKNLI